MIEKWITHIKFIAKTCCWNQGECNKKSGHKKDRTYHFLKFIIHHHFLPLSIENYLNTKNIQLFLHYYRFEGKRILLHFIKENIFNIIHFQVFHSTFKVNKEAKNWKLGKNSVSYQRSKKIAPIFFDRPMLSSPEKNKFLRPIDFMQNFTLNIFEGKFAHLVFNDVLTILVEKNYSPLSSFDSLIHHAELDEMLRCWDPSFNSYSDDLHPFNFLKMLVQLPPMIPILAESPENIKQQAFFSFIFTLLFDFF